MPSRKRAPSVESASDSVVDVREADGALSPPEDTPIARNAMRQEALSDPSHVLYAMFQHEVAHGVSEQLKFSLLDPPTYDLVDIKVKALTIAGHCQKIAQWCDRMFWELEHDE